MAQNSNYYSIYNPPNVKTERGAIQAICTHFKFAVHEDNYYWQSNDNLKIIGYAAYHPHFTDDIFKKAIVKLRNCNYNVRWTKRSDAKGWFNAIEYKIK